MSWFIRLSRAGRIALLSGVIVGLYLLFVSAVVLLANRTLATPTAIARASSGTATVVEATPMPVSLQAATTTPAPRHVASPPPTAAPAAPTAALMVSTPPSTSDVAATQTRGVEVVATAVAATLTAQPTITQVPTETPLPPASTLPLPPTATALPPATALAAAATSTGAQFSSDQVVNVREGPGTDYNIIGQLQTQTTYVVLGKNQDASWLEFDYDGQSGWVLASLVTTAGDLSSLPVAQAQPAAVVSTETSGLLFDDDFGSLQRSEALGFKASNTGTANYVWAPHQATITVTAASQYAYSLINGTYDDFGALVDLQPVGPGYAEYGIMFRWSSNPDGSDAQGYQLTVTTNGTYRFYKALNGQWVDPPLIPSTSSPYIKQGNARNVVAVLAQGPSLSVLINGALVSTVTDSSVSSGSVGFFAATQDQPPAAISFYRVTVYSADRASADWGAGTAYLSATPAVSTAPTVPVVGLLLGDDFSSLEASQADGWKFGTGDGYSSVWSPGAQTITVSNTRYFVASWAGGTYDNFGVETDAGPVTGQYAEYGILFRATTGANGVASGYLFAVSSDGRYWLSKMLDGQWVNPSPIPATASAAITQGPERNLLRVLANGPQITLFINGVVVNSLVDDSLSSGQVAAYVAAEDNPPASVAFHDWYVLTSGAATVQWLVTPSGT
jgi:hypothetical protein